jgi:hypothetical protein
MLIVNTLVVFFIFLILYQISMSWFFEEGFQSTYQPYDTNNPNNAMILAQQNAGNIEYLKQQLNSLMGLQNEVTDISSNVVTLNNQVSALTQQQQGLATGLVGSSPPNITGLSSSYEAANNPSPSPSPSSSSASAIPSDAYTSSS